MSWLKQAVKQGCNAALAPLGYEIKKRRPALRSECSPEWWPLLYANWEGLIPPRDLWVSTEEPLSQFLRWTWGWSTYLTSICDMPCDASVLELGCSHGRTALGLLPYLQPPGKYEGLDITPRQIEFAQRNIQAQYPHFRFTLAADVFNSCYNPHGQVAPETYRFPYADGSFDTIYAASLFTHLTPAVMANYLREARRVLRRGGKCLFSFFLLDYYRGMGTTTSDYFAFEHSLPGEEGVAVRDAAMPEMLIAYRIERIEKAAASAGLRVARIIPGLWSRSHKLGVCDQDLVLFEAA